MSAESRLNLDDLLFKIRLESAELLCYFGNMLKKAWEGKKRGKKYWAHVSDSADFTHRSSFNFCTWNKCSGCWVLIAFPPHLWTRWPWHPRADQGHPKRLCWGRGCASRTDGASHLHIRLVAPCPLHMATWRTAGGVQPARQWGAQNPNRLKWRERPVRLHSQKQHNGGHIWAGDRLGHRGWVMVDADLLWLIMMTVDFGLLPCIRLPDRRKTESLLRDWSLENMAKVIQRLSHALSPPIIFLSLPAIRLSFFTLGLCILLSSVWTPNSLSLLILPLWCHRF